ncbi:hypothetical protein [Streptomyces sp. NPDC056244]|uniref:hypothetical protein n=1 Tax=Streptomyces sp. NPDC056244 TaxID=3345762 RepID=UPI0035D786E3
MLVDADEHPQDPRAGPGRVVGEGATVESAAVEGAAVGDDRVPDVTGHGGLTGHGDFTEHGAVALGGVAARVP